jgi:hypothetical protein
MLQSQFENCAIGDSLMDSKERKDKQNTDKSIETTQKKTRNKKKQLVNFDANKFKYCCTLAKKNDIEIADEVNQHFKNTAQKIVVDNGMKYEFNHFDPKKMASLKSKKEKSTKNLEWHEGLALAHVLNCFAVDFIKDEILELGNFEVKLVPFGSGFEYSEHILSLEENSSVRMGIFSTLGVYPYRPIKNKQSPLNGINEKRLEKMKSQQIITFDFFTIDALLCFLFNMFDVPLTKAEKIETLERMLGVLLSNKLSKFVFYTNSDFYQRNFPMIQLFESHHLVYLNLPLRTSILAIKNKKFCNNISSFLKGTQKPFLMTTSEQSIELLEKSIFHLKNYPQPSFLVFFNTLSFDLQHFIKVAFPHSF